MRLWSLHPSLLDRQGLTAAWREALLAQAVLAGRTRGYTKHPQLERFQATSDPLAAIAAYLHAIADDADRRGYRFDRSRIDGPAGGPSVEVTDGQLDLEWHHLRAKLAERSPERLAMLPAQPLPHPSCEVRPGPVATWERATMPPPASA